MQFRDSKIVEYRAIIDSFDAAEQMIGHPIELSDTLHNSSTASGSRSSASRDAQQRNSWMYG